MKSEGAHWTLTVYTKNKKWAVKLQPIFLCKRHKVGKKRSHILHPFGVPLHADAAAILTFNALNNAVRRGGADKKTAAHSLNRLMMVGIYRIRGTEQFI